ncbi:hypothetical protein EV197_0645 [Aquimarina brevivitae]|uniref:Uncharacterized protein n=2 Tax=Aquimarina brevivitae TaxID=323412 RepID=A0A4Q7PGE3_9FLAO|nr:hypothetical protein EV197_0645 [Aquimarina brevivitae]
MAVIQDFLLHLETSKKKIMNKKYLSFPLLIIAIILGVAIFKDFNFNTLTFKNLWLDIVYIIVFIVSLFLLFKKKKAK